MIITFIGTSELLLISAVVLLIFGGKKLPELMKGMGKGVKSFKEGMSEPTEEEMNRMVEEEIRRRADDEMSRRADAEQSQVTTIAPEQESE